MASPANLFRLCLRTTRRQLPAIRTAAAIQHQQPPLFHRPLSTTAARRETAEEKDKAEDVERVFADPGEFLTNFLRDETISDKDRELASRMLDDWSKVPPEMRRDLERLRIEISEAAAPLRRPVIPKRDSFWNEEEADPDLITDELGEDDFEEDDMMAMGHGKLEEHREFREYARIAVWEMPLLSSKRARRSCPCQKKGC